MFLKKSLLSTGPMNVEQNMVDVTSAGHRRDNHAKNMQFNRLILLQATTD